MSVWALVNQDRYDAQRWPYKALGTPVWQTQQGAEGYRAQQGLSGHVPVEVDADWEQHTFEDTESQQMGARRLKSTHPWK